MPGEHGALSAVRLVSPVGNTVRAKGLGGTHVVLTGLVPPPLGNGPAFRLCVTMQRPDHATAGKPPPACVQWWFEALARNGCPLARHFITERDLRVLGGRLAIHPRSMPAFLVCVDGWFVDWFAAPAASGDPGLAVREMLQTHLLAYH